jgi:hypothetical protein
VFEVLIKMKYHGVILVTNIFLHSLEVRLDSADRSDSADSAYSADSASGEKKEWIN